MVDLRLKRGREKSVTRRHPWIFASAIEEVMGNPELGSNVEIYSSDGRWIARAAYSPHSNIRARIWTWEEEETVDQAFFERRIRQSLERRDRLRGDMAVSSYREIFAESDGLPGLVVDRYNDLRVVQFLAAGSERWRQTILDVLKVDPDCRSIYERSDVDVRGLEGLEQKRGHLWGESISDRITIHENELQYFVDVHAGHKTGFYLDQRLNRATLRSWVQPGQDVLNCFSYTGGFSLGALKAGAGRVLSIDSSNDAIQMAKANVDLNGLESQRCEWQVADVFRALRELRDRGRSFDVIVLDPPKFAATPSHVQRAARGYKDINLLAFKLLRPGGLLFSFSCSGGLSPDLFQKIVADAALDAGVVAGVVGWMAQPEDHPVGLAFPESRYLKGLICRVHA